ncbi:MAG: hypothetical protein C0458_20770 [Methylobacterium sp.]|nr:hypothetical protein [Methylobacterium sp.]
MTTTRLQFVMLALVASIHVLNTTCGQRGKDVDGRHKPDHDEGGGVRGFRAQAFGPPRKARVVQPATDLRPPSVGQQPQAPLLWAKSM